MDGPPWAPKAIANLFLDWFEHSQERVTPLKLQKVLYFCHADFLQRTGSPLVSEEFEAWRYGPVLPSVFHAFKKWTGNAIPDRATQFDPATCETHIPLAELDPFTETILRPIFDVYAPVEGGHLSGVSHRAGGPWSEAVRLFSLYQNINRRISNELIASRHRCLFQ
jgi:uncharacterized phage-associated protein